MKITSLYIKNFRNLNQLKIDNIGKINIFSGKNGQGKTNILEAIYNLSTGNSFRTNSDRHMLSFNETFYHINSHYLIDDRLFDIILTFDINKGKQFYLNRKKTSRLHTDRLRVVLFTPDDLYIIKGPPSKRRNFIDFILKQSSNEYVNLLDKYSKILNKRNYLLKKGQSNTNVFKSLNEIYIEIAAQIILYRINFINILDDIASAINKQINDSNLRIKYALSFSIESDKINLDILQQKLFEEIRKKEEQEIKRKISLIGPHLDDINIYHNDKLARLYASQGQQRNIAIILKLSEISTFYRLKGYYPILLLDEVLSELDHDRKILLMDYLLAADFQTFLTAVDIENINLKNININMVENGNIIRGL